MTETAMNTLSDERLAEMRADVESTINAATLAGGPAYDIYPAEFLRTITELQSLRSAHPAVRVKADHDSIRIVRQFADQYRSGAQGALLECDAAQTVALAIDDILSSLDLSPAEGEVRGPCIPVIYCGLATSTHVPSGSDEDHCDLCGHPAQPLVAPSNPVISDRTAWQHLQSLTFAVQHSPNCPSPYLVRLPGASGLIDMKSYGDPLGLKPSQTGDVLGFGKTLEQAATAALSVKQQSGSDKP